MAKAVKLKRRGELAPGVRGERIIYLNGGSQVVINDKKWTTRQPLLRLMSEVPLARSA